MPKSNKWFYRNEETDNMSFFWHHCTECNEQWMWDPPRGKGVQQSCPNCVMKSQPAVEEPKKVEKKDVRSVQ